MLKAGSTLLCPKQVRMNTEGRHFLALCKRANVGAGMPGLHVTAAWERT